MRFVEYSYIYYCDCGCLNIAVSMDGFPVFSTLTLPFCSYKGSTSNAGRNPNGIKHPQISGRRQGSKTEADGLWPSCLQKL